MSPETQLALGIIGTVAVACVAFVLLSAWMDHCDRKWRIERDYTTRPLHLVDQQDPEKRDGWVI